MVLSADYVVIGSGLTGVTIARLLADAGREVVVIERRRHVGGNVYDETHSSGVRVHVYGPHYFRTNSDRIWAFVTKYSQFYRFEARIFTYVDDTFHCWPIQARYIEQLCGPKWTPAFGGQPQNFEEAALSAMPSVVYEKIVKGYTEKQWGEAARSLLPALAMRFEVRQDGDSRLSRYKYQGLPSEGYTAWILRMLEGIPTVLGKDYLKDREAVSARKRLIYTGPIDEYCDFKYGKLKYRSQRREHSYLRNQRYRLPGVQVNYPSRESGPQVRTIEWKHLMPPEAANDISGTLTTDEIPFTPTDPNEYEYPFPDAINQLLYQRYLKETSVLSKVLICGRLGEYRYLDMDQAMERAMTIGDAVLQDAKVRGRGGRYAA
jgi:UDP-galactopyranose mutase